MNLDFALSSGFVVLYCVGIGAFLGRSLQLLLRQTKWLESKLDKVRQELSEGDKPIAAKTQLRKAMAAQFEAYNQEVEKTLGSPWAEFVETLILPDPGSDDPIRNTGEVSRYLNDATIIFPHLSAGFFQAVPNLLTGLGILGTFIGLAAGVGAASTGLSSGVPGEITTSLQELLAGAALAFWTSICGIVCSIAFVLVEKRRSRRLHLALDQWVSDVEARFERVTPEGVALQQLHQAERAATQLEHFNTDLVFALEQALEEKIANRLSPQLQALLEAVERLRADRSTDSGQMIEKALARFNDSLRSQTGSQFEEMAETIQKLNCTLQASTDGLAQTGNDARNAIDALLRTVQTSMQSTTDDMVTALQHSLGDVKDVLASASNQLAESLTASGTEAASNLEKTLNVATQEMTAAGANAVERITGSLDGLQTAASRLERSTQQSERVLSGMNRFVEGLDALHSVIESTHEHIADVAEPVGRAAHEIRESMQSTADATRRMQDLINRAQTLTAELGRYQQSVADTWKQYQARFEGIDESLEQVFLHIENGLSKYCDQVKNFVDELDKTTGTTVNMLAGATSELTASIEVLTESLPRREG